MLILLAAWLVDSVPPHFRALPYWKEQIRWTPNLLRSYLLIWYQMPWLQLHTGILMMEGGDGWWLSISYMAIADLIDVCFYWFSNKTCSILCLFIFFISLKWIFTHSLQSTVCGQRRTYMNMLQNWLLAAHLIYHWQTACMIQTRDMVSLPHQIHMSILRILFPDSQEIWTETFVPWKGLPQKEVHLFFCVIGYKRQHFLCPATGPLIMQFLPLFNAVLVKLFYKFGITQAPVGYSNSHCWEFPAL